MIAALFVETNGCYFGSSAIDPWDINRDARDYHGPYPVVAHPPCQLWGNLAFVNHKRWGGDHNKPGNDQGCFESALTSLRKNGGVLEHPQRSRAFEKYGIRKPKKGQGWQPDGEFWVCEVWQSDYGHRARKATWLVYKGNRKPFDLRWEFTVGTHQVGFQDQRGKERNKPTLSKREAAATPYDFRQELIRLAQWSRT